MASLRTDNRISMMCKEYGTLFLRQHQAFWVGVGGDMVATGYNRKDVGSAGYCFNSMSLEFDYDLRKQDKSVTEHTFYFHNHLVYDRLLKCIFSKGAYLSIQF